MTVVQIHLQIFVEPDPLSEWYGCRNGVQLTWSVLGSGRCLNSALYKILTHCSTQCASDLIETLLVLY